MPSSAIRFLACFSSPSNIASTLEEATGVGMISVCSKMWSTSAAAAPKAHQVEAALRCGTITLRTPSSRAKTPACAGPAPPKANSTKSRGSKPFSTVTLRITSAICSSTMRQMPAAHSAASIPRGFASWPMEFIAACFFNFIFAGGKMKLNKQAAINSIGQLAKPLGMDAAECAAGICRIVELQMADVIRKVTVEKGFDPRDFVLFAFGGAGPAHAGVFARELGVRKVIVPQRKAASTWCAFGAAAADVLHIFEHTEIMAVPVAASRINKLLNLLEDKAKKLMAGEGIAAARQRFEFSLDVRHKGQINEVEIFLPWTRLPSGYE